MVLNTFTMVVFSALMVALIVIIYGIKNKLNAAKKIIQTQQQNLSQSTQIQQQSDVAKSDAIAANHAKSRYLSGISHELRTPLNVIMGYAQLLENQSNTDDIHHEKYTLMRHNCEHLAHLIEGILEFSAIESGKLKVKLEPINLHDMLNQIVMMFNNQAEQKGLKFISQVAGNLPKVVKTDYKRLQQIIINLLSNAIKFTQHGQVEFIVTYRNQVAKFQINDSGCGIQADDLDRIFEPFERIENPKSPVIGTGLGLPITKMLVELLGGELNVQSQPDHGSQFVVKIMLSAQSDSTDSAEEQPIVSLQPSPDTTHRHKILVVDDQDSQRELIRDILQPQGFDTQVAADAYQAQKLFEQHTFKLIVIDVAMPGMTGWELAEWVHLHWPQVKIMMLSANPRDAEASSIRHHDVYLTKPFKINQLLNSINQLLALNTQQVKRKTTQTAATESVHLSPQAKTALLNMIDIGHINGIETYLNRLHIDQQITGQQYQYLQQPIKQMNLSTFNKMIEHD